MDLNRRRIVQALMQVFLVVKLKVPLQALFQVTYRGIVVQTYLLKLDRAPQVSIYTRQGSPALLGKLCTPLPQMAYFRCEI